MAYIKYRTVENWNYMSHEISIFNYLFYNPNHQFAQIGTSNGLMDIGIFISHEEYMDLEAKIFELIALGRPMIDLAQFVAFSIHDDMSEDDYKNALFNTLHNSHEEKKTN